MLIEDVKSNDLPHILSRKQVIR